MTDYTTSKVEYVDPSSIYPVISGDLQKNLPLRNLYWNSATRPLRSIASLHIELVKAGTRDTPSAPTARYDPATQNGAIESTDKHGSSQRDVQPGSGVAAKKARRHQIPGLRQTPYLKIFFLRCSDVDSYRNRHRKQIREWIKDNIPPSQSTASVNTEEFHDAFEWLIVHVVLPDDGRSISRPSNTSKNDMQSGPRVSSAVTEKVRADFNGSSKAAVDRVAQVQITRSSELDPGAGKDQDSFAGWEEFISKAKSLILSSFDLRVTQYEEDIKERDSQRQVPGWNFNTFFVLKEGLARGFESVGLIEDALTGYQELTLGLTSIIETSENEEQHRDHFKTYTDDLSSELKRALQSEKSHEQHESDTSSARSVTGNRRGQADRGALGADILNIERKPFRELILANEISIFDFRCYLFARETSLLLRLANASRPTGVEARSVNVPWRPPESDSQDFLILAEICRRAVEFFAAAGRIIREDLRSSIHPLSRGRATGSPSSLSPFEGAIEDIVASWTYSASQCILDVTSVSSLTAQLQPLLGNLKPSEEAHNGPQSPATALSRDELPRRTSSLPMQVHSSPRASSPEKFPTSTSLDATRLLPPTSSQTGTQELAAQRAELVSLERRVIASVANRRSNFNIHRIDLVVSGSSSQQDMEEISLSNVASGIANIENGHKLLNAGPANGLQHPYLNHVLASEDAFSEAFEVASALSIMDLNAKDLLGFDGDGLSTVPLG